MMKLLFLALSP
jgi:hypothetical protein